MDVDDLIAHHKTRLSEHRKFLGNHNNNTVSIISAPSLMNSPNAGGNSPLPHRTSALHAASDIAASLSPVQPRKKERHLAAAHGGPFDTMKCGRVDSSNSNCEKRQQQHKQQHPSRCHSAKHLTEERRMQKRCDLFLSQALALANADASYRRREKEQFQCPCNEDSPEYNGDQVDRVHRASSNPVSFFGYVGAHERFVEEDRFFENLLKVAGRYCIKKPDAMYVKSKMWLEGRARSLQQLQREQTQSNLDECSFQPNVQSSLSRASLSKSRSVPHEPSDDPSVVAHMERLEEARQQRAEAERKVMGKGAGTWTNRVTRPKAFVFARKIASIPSLRKPFIAAGAAALHEDILTDPCKKKEYGGKLQAGNTPIQE